MKLYLLILLPFSSLMAQMQPLESKAFDYLMSRFDELLINYKADTVKFERKNKIWCDNRLIEDEKAQKIPIKTASTATYEEFKKATGDKKDICIRVHKATADGDFHLVKFEIISRDGSKTIFYVPLDAKNEPYTLFKSKYK